MTIGHSITGSGPTRVIVLHGWLSDGGVFDKVRPYFDPNTYSLAFMDFRGYGASKTLEGTYTIDEVASDVLALADQLDWETFHIVGHSMGGMVVQKVALLAPNRVLSGVAVAPVSAAGFAMDMDTAAFFQSSVEDDDALAEIFNVLTGKRHAGSFLKVMTGRTREATTKDAYLGYLDAWTNTDFASDVAAVKTPVLVLAGEHDGALGPDHMRETYLKHLPNVDMHVLKEAGHYPMVETPAAFFTHLDAFLTEQGS